MVIDSEFISFKIVWTLYIRAMSLSTRAELSLLFLPNVSIVSKAEVSFLVSFEFELVFGAKVALLGLSFIGGDYSTGAPTSDPLRLKFVFDCYRSGDTFSVS